MIWTDNPLEFAQNRIDSRQYILLPRIGDLINKASVSRILDYGCGEGYLSRSIVDKKAEIGLFDISPEMLELASRNMKNEGFVNLQAFNTPGDIPSEHYEVVVLSLVLMTIGNDADYLAVLGECCRALRSGGSLIIGVTHPCFRRALFSTHHTEYSLGVGFNYFENHRPFDVYLRTSKSDRFLEFADFHHNLSYMFSMFNKVGLRVTNLEELQDRSIEKSYFNQTASPYMLLVCEKR